METTVHSGARPVIPNKDGSRNQMECCDFSVRGTNARQQSATEHEVHAHRPLDAPLHHLGDLYAESGQT